MASSNSILHNGLRGKLRVTRSDIITHPADMIICPSDEHMSDDWNTLTKRIRRAAGPFLTSMISDKYINKPLEAPPPCFSDTRDVNSPSGSFFRAVRYTPSFRMSHCDWIAHVRAPLYRRTRSLEEQRLGNLNLADVENRNGSKYSSVFLALKVAHRVALKKRKRIFTVAIPQIQLDGGYFTPKDDAILTLSAIVDFFNHPEWGARRLNAIDRVDITIDPTPMGQVYCQAYNSAWYSMSMHTPSRNVYRSPRSVVGLLQRPYPAVCPRLPSLDPHQGHPSDSAVPSLVQRNTHANFGLFTGPQSNEDPCDSNGEEELGNESQSQYDGVEEIDELETEYESEHPCNPEDKSDRWSADGSDCRQEPQNRQSDELMGDDGSHGKLLGQANKSGTNRSKVGLTPQDKADVEKRHLENNQPKSDSSQGGPPSFQVQVQDLSAPEPPSKPSITPLKTDPGIIAARSDSISRLVPPRARDSRSLTPSTEGIRSVPVLVPAKPVAPAIERVNPASSVSIFAGITPAFDQLRVPIPSNHHPGDPKTAKQSHPKAVSFPKTDQHDRKEIFSKAVSKRSHSAAPSTNHSDTQAGVLGGSVPSDDWPTPRARRLAREIAALNEGFDSPYWTSSNRKRKRTRS